MTQLAPTIGQQAQQLGQLVRHTRSRLRRNSVLTGVAMTVAIVVGCLVLMAAIDMALPMPVALRVALASVLAAVVLVCFALLVLWPAVRPIRSNAVASRIERTVPRMHNRLITVLEMGAIDGRQDTFLDRLIQQTAERLAGFRIEQVAPPRHLRRASTAAAAVVTVAVLMLVGFPERMPTAIARIVQPTAPIPPVSWVKLTADPGDTDVLQGDPLTVRAVVDRGDPERIDIRLRPVGGKWTTYRMDRDMLGRFSYRMSAVETSYEYQLLGGGTWTPPHRIRAVRRPIVEDVDLAVRFPQYMRRPEPRPVDNDAGRVTAPVGGHVIFRAGVLHDPVEGRIETFRRITETRTKEVESEVVWFEDDVPDDAVVEGTWRWVTSPVYSGERAHTFDWSGEPYGLTTRLNPLTLTPSDSLFLYVRLDREDPPERLRVQLDGEPTSYLMIWGPKPKKLPTVKGRETVYAGELPEPGQWHRLGYACEMLPGMPGSDRELKVRGIRFETTGGEIHFDRAGALAYRDTEQQITRLESTGVTPMRFDEEAGQWIGELPVEEDALAKLWFTNAQGHRSADMEPIPVIAARDLPPSLLVERPSRSLTVDEPTPVPVWIRSSDDFGVAAVGMSFARDPNQLGEPDWMFEYDEQVKTSRLTLSSIDPRAREMTPGGSIFYTIHVRDYAGQTARSEVHRLSLVANTAATDPGDGGDELSRDALLDGLSDLLTLSGNVATGAGELLGQLLPDHEISLNPAGDLQVHTAEGVMLSAEQIEALFKDVEGELSEPQRDRISELLGGADDLAEMTAQMADRLSAAAAEAEASEVAMPLEAEALSALADEVRQMQPDAAQPGDAADEAALQRLAELRSELSPEQQAQMQRLQQQLAEMREAREMLGENPEAAQQTMEQLATRIEAQRAIDDMQRLDRDLQNREQQLAQMRAELEQLRAAAEAQEKAALDEVSQQQEQFDPQAIDAMREARELLEQPGEQPADMVAPWQPPGEPVDRMPVEQDTPPEEDPEAGADADAASSAPAEQETDDADWWDRPVDMPEPARRAEMDERFEDRSREVEPEFSNTPPQAATPREMLREHQDAMHQQLTQEGQRLQQASGEISQLQQQMQQAMQQAQSAAQQSSQTPAQASQQQQQQQATQQLQEMMRSSAMQRMQSMSAASQAQAMRAMMQGQAGQTGETDPNAAGSPQNAGRRPGALIQVDLSDVDAPGIDAAELYRLPPTMRRSLIQGMRETGPEGYQPLIDAYYRQLGRESK